MVLVVEVSFCRITGCPGNKPVTSCPGNYVIAVCAKVWNRVNLSIFASSEAETCSASIAMTSNSISIILVVLESPR